MTGAASVAAITLGTVRVLRDAPTAREPWAQAGESLGDPRLDALAYAILAPSAHNRQPWIFRLEGSDRITILPDLDRLLPQTDPLNRQIVISFGAMIELLRMAAEAGGHALSVTPFPNGEPHPTLDARPIAHVDFKPETATVDPLMDTVLGRRSNKSKFLDRDVEPSALQSVLSIAEGRAGLFGNAEAIRQICRESWAIEHGLTRTHEESVRLTRIGAREVAAEPDGISLQGPMIEGLSAAGLLDRDAMRMPGTTAYEQGHDFYDGLIASAQTFIWLKSESNNREAQLRAGRDWVRLNLAANRAGLAFHPLSQCLQEFPEMSGPFARAHALAGIDAAQDSRGARLQGVFRLGYAPSPKPSPRWPLQSRLSPSMTSQISSQRETDR